MMADILDQHATEVGGGGDAAGSRCSPAPVSLKEPRTPTLIGRKVACSPSWIESLGDFYVQLKGGDETRLAQLMEKIEAVVKKTDTTTTTPESGENEESSLTETPAVGSWVAAPFQDTHYRGIVEEFVDESRAVVFFIDYGNRDEVARADLLELPERLQNER